MQICKNCNKKFEGKESNAKECLDFCCYECEDEYNDSHRADMREDEDMERRHERELKDRDLNDNSIYSN